MTENFTLIFEDKVVGIYDDILKALDKSESLLQEMSITNMDRDYFITEKTEKTFLVTSFPRNYPMKFERYEGLIKII
jgi:hypothetical protein